MLIGKSDVNISEFNANLVSKIEAPKRSTLGKTQNRREENDLWNGCRIFCSLYSRWVIP